MMTKQALLENVLDMWLTQKQIETIKTGWKAFYENPMQYKNSVVIDMVKQFLKEVAWNNYFKTVYRYNIIKNEVI